MSKVVKAVVGVAAAVAGVLLQQPWLTSLGVSMFASAILSPSTGGGAEQRQASETTLQLGEGPRQALFGTAATGGSLLDGFNFGGKYGTDWEVVLLALADHECESLEGFYVNDKYVTFAGDGAVSGYNGQLEVYWLPGTATQAWPSIVTANSDWTAADNCKGVCCVAVAYKADETDAKNPVWTAGRPRFLWVLKGKKCYLARKDSTVAGGSGSHRWDDPSTWEWTDNPAECRYQYQRGIFALDQVDQPDQLLIGRGLSAIEAPPERSIAHANVCDESVALAAGGTRRRYTFNGMIGADEDFLTAEGYFAAATAGIIRQPDGGIEVEPGQAKATSAEITDLDILNLTEVTVEKVRGEGDKEWVNTLVPRHVAPEQKWQMSAAPIKRDFADVIADGGPRLETLELKHVTNGPQAQALAEIRRRLGRLQATSGLTLGPRFVELEEGDWIGWTSDRHFGGGRKVFRIDSYARTEKWHMQLQQLREISASVYGDEEDEEDQTEATQQDEPPAIGAPAVEDWNLVGGQIDGAKGVLPALLLTGAVDNPYADAVRFEYRVDGATDWIDAGTGPRNITAKTIRGVGDGIAYEVGVTYIVDGEPGDRLVLGPATTGSLSAGRAARRFETRTVLYPLSSDDTSIAVVAFDGVLNDGSEVSMPADTITGLTAGTSYGVFYDPATSTYSAVVSPAIDAMKNSSLIFVGGFSTSDGGTYTPPDDPPPGSGGFNIP